MYIYVCIYINIYFYICIRTHIYTTYVYICVYAYAQIYTHIYVCICTFGTGWRRVIGCLICIGHFSQKSRIISSSFAKNDVQLQASDESWRPCV